MVSPKMLKSQIHIVAGGGFGGQLLMLSPKILKSPKFTFSKLEEGGWHPPLMLSPEMLKFQIHIFAGVGGGRVGGQPLMLSPEMQKSPKFKFSQVGEWGWWPTFDAESKNPKIQNSHCCRRGGWWSTFDAESRNAKKFQIQTFTGGRVGLAANF